MATDEEKAARTAVKDWFVKKGYHSPFTRPMDSTTRFHMTEAFIGGTEFGFSISREEELIQALIEKDLIISGIEEELAQWKYKAEELQHALKYVTAWISVKSSRGSDSPQTEEASLPQSHYSAPDDVSVQKGSQPMTATIPDALLAKVAEDFLKGGHRDSPGPLGPMGYPRNPTANAEDAITNMYFSKVDKK